ncbi:uncharacterized protein LOC117220215 isoform X2 [Megalopta genalis]|uniref:uncharacterized protein LOC117220215 isoform X2 n=1 Tax=Megalopta genalis TaxID=115081 RepID=UPI003FD55B5C
MLKPLYSSFCRAKLEKLHYWWMCPSNAFSKSTTRKLTQDSDEKIVSKNDDETVNSMDKLSLNNIMIDIEKKVVKQKKKRKQTKLRTTPKIVKLEMPKTVLAVHVGATMLSWTLLDCNYDVLDMNWHHWNNQANLYDLITLISAITPTIPIAATYIVEDTYIPHKGSSIQRLLTQQQLGVSIMSCILLRERLLSESLESTNNIYVLHTFFAAKWFGLIVGQEIVSSEYIMKKLLDVSAQTANKPHISINSELKFKYMKLPDIERDQVSWSLLKAVSFLHTIETRKVKKVNNVNNE